MELYISDYELVEQWSCERGCRAEFNITFLPRANISSASEA